jgi:hypothetical protein
MHEVYSATVLVSAALHMRSSHAIRQKSCPTHKTATPALSADPTGWDVCTVRLSRLQALYHRTAIGRTTTEVAGWMVRSQAEPRKMSRAKGNAGDPGQKRRPDWRRCLPKPKEAAPSKWGPCTGLQPGHQGRSSLQSGEWRLAQQVGNKSFAAIMEHRSLEPSPRSCAADSVFAIVRGNLSNPGSILVASFCLWCKRCQRPTSRSGAGGCIPAQVTGARGNRKQWMLSEGLGRVPALQSRRGCGSAAHSHPGCRQTVRVGRLGARPMALSDPSPSTQGLSPCSPPFLQSPNPARREVFWFVPMCSRAERRTQICRASAARIPKGGSLVPGPSESLTGSLARLGNWRRASTRAPTKDVRLPRELLPPL